jgi:EmrB/QacA subfamily drug resistance transporter
MTTTAEKANAKYPAESRKWFTLLVLALGLAIVIIDGTIVNVAVPSIRKEFNTNLRNLEWVNSIYSLIYAALIVTWGRVGDQVGRKRLFIVGVSVFVAGSMLAGISPNIGFLIVARAIQGLGAAMTSPSTLSIVSSTFTGKMCGVAFGVWGAVAGASAALGPLLGGWLTANASWRWAFYINVPIGLIAIIGSIIFIQESRESRHKTTFDIPGILLVTLGLSGLVFGLIEGQAYGWWQPKQIFSLVSWNWPLTNLAITPFCLLIGAIALTGFVFWENRVRSHGGDPLFDFTLLRFRGFRFGLLTVSIVALGEFGVIFVLSTAIIKGLNDSGGGEGGSAPSGAPAGAANSPMGKEITRIVQQSFVNGARSAARTASFFVLLGAFSSLLIPNTIQRKPQTVLVSE